MGWASRRNQKEQEEGVIVRFPNEEMRQEFINFTKRTGSMAKSVKKFLDAGLEFDFDSPEFQNQIAPHAQRLFMELLKPYPSEEIFNIDLETLKIIRKV